MGLEFDWKKTLPYIASAVTGGVPALIATAATALTEALGVTVEPTKEGIDAALKGATPEQLLALKKVDNDLKIRFRELDSEDKKADIDLETTYVQDVSNARQFNSNTDGILYLGYLINLASYGLILFVLYACFSLMTGGSLGIDPGTAAMIGGIIGAAVQWIMQNASQANGFFFGSSPSSRKANEDLVRSITESSKKLK
jgi:small-conductance mechanosensitive channel